MPSSFLNYFDLGPFLIAAIPVVDAVIAARALSILIFGPRSPEMYSNYSKD